MSGVLLLLSACVAAIAIIGVRRLPRFEAAGVVLFIVVVGCVGVGGWMSSWLQSAAVADGRALIPCAIGPLLALSLQADLLGRLSGPAIGGAATILLISGLSAHATVLAGAPGADVAVVVALAFAAGAAIAAAVTTTRRARALSSPLLRARGMSESLGVGLVGLAALIAGVEVLASAATTLWAALVGLGALLAATARTSTAPLGLRDGALAAGAGALAAVVAPDVALAVVPAVAIGLVSAHGLWPARAPGLAATAPFTATTSPSGPLVAGLALQALPPVLDDPTLRRPTRPRVLARTPARRLVDAAIDRAWRSSSTGRGRAPVDVVGGEDVDVDGDASELAEALCAVLDAALREQRTRDGRVTVTVRAAPQNISFEVDDVGVDDDTRPFLDKGADGEREPGLGLARARILVERHGGQLHVRRGGRGAVHLTLPRRLHRGPVGLA